MKRMKGFRAVTALVLAFVMLLGNALAKTYDISVGGIIIHVTVDDQLVKQGTDKEVSDREPVIITGKTTGNTVTINADQGTAAEVTFKDLDIDVSGKTYTAAVKTEGDGNVAIELDGDNSLKSGNMAAGLQKENGGVLTINDQNEDGGSLDATGGKYAAGIGGGYDANGSNITINGGEVTATGGNYAAGIGGGTEANGSNITINGGKVTANGGYQGAGIGSGDEADGSNITINGGEVTATGGNYAAGIGGGDQGNGSDITINGGTVTTQGGNDSAGIGGGAEANGSHITINGGEVTANGGAYAAGIGGGQIGDGTDITINGGTVTAQGGEDGAGIGGGDYGNGTNIT